MLPAVVDEDAAIRDGAPQLHDNVPGNVTTVFRVKRRRLPKGRPQEADHVITPAHRQQPADPDLLWKRVIDPGRPQRRRHLDRLYRRARCRTCTGAGSPRPSAFSEHHAAHRRAGYRRRLRRQDASLSGRAALPLSGTRTRRAGEVVGIRARKPSVHQPWPRPYRRPSRSPSATTATILGMRVETLGNVGAYLSNMASGGPTVNTINYGTGTYKIDELRGGFACRGHQHGPCGCLSRLRAAGRRLYRRTDHRCGGSPPQPRSGRSTAQEFHPARRLSLPPLQQHGRDVRQRQLPGSAGQGAGGFQLHEPPQRTRCIARAGAAIAASALPPIPICAAWRRPAASP